jgi:ribosomal protein S6E (S10)
MCGVNADEGWKASREMDVIKGDLGGDTGNLILNSRMEVNGEWNSTGFSMNFDRHERQKVGELRDGFNPGRWDRPIFSSVR